MSPQALSSEASEPWLVLLAEGPLCGWGVALPEGEEEAAVAAMPLWPEARGWSVAMASGQKRSTGRTVCTLAFLAFCCWLFSGLLASSMGCRILRRALMNQLLT